MQNPWEEPKWSINDIRNRCLMIERNVENVLEAIKNIEQRQLQQEQHQNRQFEKLYDGLRKQLEMMYQALQKNFGAVSRTTPTFNFFSGVVSFMVLDWITGKLIVVEADDRIFVALGLCVLVGAYLTYK
ncbi:hypothetical protein F5Y13DRAFT_189756 [Hypoxylon sp. FL1857]|nr:hypothetical protein F5Y13DRAFT_189756 [Hypoxylon sp. FL1857]